MRIRRPQRLRCRRAWPGGAAPMRLRRATTSKGHRRGRAAALGFACERRLIGSFDIGLHAVARVVVMDLPRWRLHEVRRRSHDRAAQAAVERELAATDRVDDDARAVRGIQYLE